MTKKISQGLMTIAAVCVIAVGLRMAAAATGCVLAPAGLVSWWPGDGSAQDIKGSNDGTLKNGTANLFDTRQLLNGAHTLTVELVRLNGSVERRTVSFNVNNPAPAVTQKLRVSTTANRSNPVDLNGRVLTGSVAIFVTPTTSVKSVAFWLDESATVTAPLSIRTCWSQHQEPDFG